jgi:hypothetical protein
MTDIWPFIPTSDPTFLSHAKGAYLYLQGGQKYSTLLAVQWSPI